MGGEWDGWMTGWSIPIAQWEIICRGKSGTPTTAAILNKEGWPAHAFA